MADISKIQIENGTYDIKDVVARNQINKLTTKKYLFVGDSYGVGYTPDGIIESWIDKVVSRLNLSNSQYIKLAQGGASFASVEGNISFYDLINNNVNSDDEITDIIICGGYNDFYDRCTEQLILTGISNVKTLCNTKFPNAKIYVGFIGNTNNVIYKYQMGAKSLVYVKGCSLYGLNYLNNVQYALHNYYTELSSDGIHPTLLGQTAIANAVIQAYLTGTATVIKDYCMINPNYTDIGVRLNNNIAILDIINPIFINGLNVTNLSCDGTSEIDAMTITDGYIIGNNIHSASGITNVVYVLTGGGFIDIPTRIEIRENKLKLMPISINDEGNNYRSINVSTVYIFPISFTFESLDI